ncbi:MAG: FliO/MopB family protein [Acidobacteriaceae bacterium]|nr:FliO/MopB family protein [Acidobacteriaceae bacterium]MBV9294080.1 FliO/MopB family protein [Acidobacteriaceae bacterium]
MTSVSVGWGEYVRLMLVLCGILALAVVAIRVWLPKISMWNKSAAGPIEICARLPLEPRRTLYIVKAANSYMLLASSEAGVQHLAALSADEWSGLRAKGDTATPAKL